MSAAIGLNLNNIIAGKERINPEETQIHANFSYTGSIIKTGGSQ